MKNIFFFLLILFVAASCEPVQDPEIDLPPAPAAPSFTATPLADNPNGIVIAADASQFFDFVWDLPGGTPSSSTQAVDTIQFNSQGSYMITLYASAIGGGGAASASQVIEIAEDADIACDENTSLLTGECSFEGKCWVFSNVGGAITVGPTAGSSEWFTSPADGLEPTQYDDSSCFLFDGLIYEYRNNGQTVNPFNGYAVEDFTPEPNQTWSFVAGAGTEGKGQIVLPEGAFMGVRDCGPIYDIVELTETELVVRSRLVDANGNVADEGWFELYFVAAQ